MIQNIVPWNGGADGPTEMNMKRVTTNTFLRNFVYKVKKWVGSLKEMGSQRRVPIN